MRSTCATCVAKFYIKNILSNFYLILCVDFVYKFRASWKKLLAFHRNKYMEPFPTCLRSLLNDTGYNTIASLSCIDDAKILEIEQFLTENKDIVNKLECCFSTEYKSLDNFHFMPGHKSMISSIRDDIKEMKELNAAKKRDKKHLLPDNLIFENLLTNLKAVAGKAGYKKAETIVSEANLHDFKRVSDESDIAYRCWFRCPVCPKTFGLIYKKFWMSSNATTHLKKHILSMKQRK